MLQGFDYKVWLAMARRAKASAAAAADAEDLLQEAVLVAIRAERVDFRVEQTRKWFTGVLRNVSREAIRSARRRTAREKLAPNRKPEDTTEVDIDVRSFGPTNRRLATLLMAGMNRDELAQVFGTSDAALRQRIVVLRRAIRAGQAVESGEGAEPAASRVRSLGVSLASSDACRPELPTGLIRRALIHAIAALDADAAVGTHDPDGHPIVLVKRKS